MVTRWSSASVPGAPSDPLPTDPDWAGGSLYVDRRSRAVDASPDALWRVIEGIGGDHGWYSFPLAWRVRGLADRLVGGVGLRRGRRDPERVYVGETIDFWRVEEREPGTLLRLRAEMRLPGLAWLELGVEPAGDARSTYVQRAVFHPRGLLGHLYWWAVAPFHGIVFGGMARNIAAAAEEQQRVRWSERGTLPHPVAGVVLVDDRRRVAELRQLVLGQQPGLVHVGVVQRRPAPRRTAARSSPRGSWRRAWRTTLYVRLNRESVPVPATHCQFIVLFATSASSSRSVKCCAPSRQSM